MKLQIREASESDRKDIYRLRHSVYARELAQHSENQDGSLTDDLDDFNTYIAAVLGDRVLGFVSITPPGQTYSVDKYISRDVLPFELGEHTYETRLLTVDRSHRNGNLAILLTYAGFRWVEAHGGTRIIAMGRTDLLEFYQKTGFQGTGVVVRSGALTFEIMSATVDRGKEFVGIHKKLIDRIVNMVDWQIDILPKKFTQGFHGGAFFKAIGDDFKSLEKSREIINADVLDAWFLPSPKVLNAMQEYLPWILRTSPPTNCAGTIRMIADTRGVDVECILPGSGSSDLIFRVLPKWLSSKSRVLVIDPTYGEYVHILENVLGCKVDRIILDRQDSFIFDPLRLKKYFDIKYDLIVLVNPNNPTGLHVKRGHLEEVLRLASTKTKIWIDETYIEYAGTEQSLEKFASTTKNVVVCKSMSKVYALSGLRVGYLCGAPELLDQIRPLTPPWVVSLPAQIAAVMALQEPGYYQEKYHQTHKLSKDLADELVKKTDIEVLPGVANFLLCHIPSGGPNAATLIEACRKRDLFLRDASVTSLSLGPSAFRIAVKDGKTNLRMVEIIQQVLEDYMVG